MLLFTRLYRDDKPYVCLKVWTTMMVCSSVTFISRFFQEKLIVNTILKRCGSKSMTSMRYDTEFLMECLLLRIKSKKAYDHLKTAKILPLSHPNTIRRLPGGMDCKFGMNDFALQCIKRNLVRKMKNLCYGSVFFDEMKIAENITFNAKTLTFDGYVDFGSDFEITKHEVQIADHVLVVGFRPYRASWIQPITAFAAKGATPASALHEHMN